VFLSILSSVVKLTWVKKQNCYLENKLVENLSDICYHVGHGTKH